MDTTEPIARALALFDQYAEMAHTDLHAALARLQAEDPGACTELVRMLAADDRTHTFPSALRWFSAIEPSAIDLPKADPSETGLSTVGGIADVASRNGSDDRGSAIWPDGTRLGPWRVEGILGLGGMGVVYAAQRADGLYEREVALKTIRADLISPATRDAFAKERRHLAKLEHPSIVALYDAGIADDGQPWLAMQRIHGDDIDRWCDANRADLRLRAKMLIEACDAIAHAHAHGILHQDIKPSNLQVDEYGKVKLLDFGLSALGSQEDKNFVRVGVSSAYAAPEVFEGAPPSVAIDVYALGVVLYRMLCDGWPRKPRSWAAMAPTVLEAPQSPSHLALNASSGVARTRGARDPRRLSRLLRPDLDAIAIRCVRRDPTERYASVADISADLRAWLERRPVAAHRDSWVYRAKRFVRRNAVAVLALSLLGLGVAGIGAVTLQQRQRERLDAQNTEILSQLFEKSLGAATLSSLGSTPLASQALLEDAERQLRRAAGERRPQFLARGLSVLARSYLVRADYEKTQRLLAESGALDPDNPLQRARNDAVLAQLFNMRAKSEQAEKAAEAGLSSLPKGEAPDLVRARLDLQMQLALAHYMGGDSKSAVAILDTAVKSAESLGAAGAIPLAELLAKRGSIRFGSAPIETVEHDFKRALALLGSRDRVVRNQIERLYVSILQYSGHEREAYLYASQALIRCIEVFGPRHTETAGAWNTIGKTWFYRGDTRRARTAFRLSAQIIRDSIGRFHPDLGYIMVFESGMDYVEGDLPGALAKSREAQAIYERVFGPDHEETLRRMGDSAYMVMLLGRYSADERKKAAHYREAEGLLSAVIRESEHKGNATAFFRDKRVLARLYFGGVEDAERDALTAVADAERMYGPNSSILAVSKSSLLRVRIAQKRCGDARALRKELLPLLSPEEKRDFNDFFLLDLFLDEDIVCGKPAAAYATYASLRRLAQHKRLPASIMRSLPRPDTPSGTWLRR